MTINPLFLLVCASFIMLAHAELEEWKKRKK